MNSFSLMQIAETLSISKRATELRAKREFWPYTEEPVRGGKRRLYQPENLPREVRDALLVYVAKNLSMPQRTCHKTGASSQPDPAWLVVADRKPNGSEILSNGIRQDIQRGVHASSRADLTDDQRLQEDARLGVRAAIKRLQQGARCSQEAAMVTLLTQARAGQIEPVLGRMLRLARDERGRKGDGSGLPAVRTLKRWLKDATPKAKSQPKVPPWGSAFLAYYQRPQKPSVDAAYRLACKEKAFGSESPSIHQVRRFLDMLGTVTRETGRLGNHELKNLKPFIRRDFSQLEPNDIWSGDGHTFDAEVQHPLHGRPFRPEITTFIDIATRRLVAWSVGLAESSWAVADALRWGVEHNGIPAMIYVDNGSGYRNAFMNDKATGLIGRIQATMVHSLPYNSQAKGVIERSHQTLWVQAAKELPSYMGHAMDREARLEQFKLTRKALKHGGTMPLIPWDLFIEFCQQIIEEYNARVHRSLKRLSPDLAWANFKAKGWTPVFLQPEELDTLFRPRTERITERGELKVMTNIYFSSLLKEFTGNPVHVAYDIHDPSKVWVYLPDGRFLCTADINGNSKHYYPVAVVEQARQKRAQGRLNRVDVKRDEILAELHGAPALAAAASETIVIGGRVINPAEAIAAREAVSVMQEVTAEALPPSIPRIQPAAPARSRSDMSLAEVAAEWETVGQRLQDEAPVSEQDRNFYQRWPQSSQGRVWFKRQGNGA
jgi:putative transposase